MVNVSLLKILEKSLEEFMKKSLRKIPNIFLQKPLNPTEITEGIPGENAGKSWSNLQKDFNGNLRKTTAEFLKECLKCFFTKKKSENLRNSYTNLKMNLWEHFWKRWWISKEICKEIPYRIIVLPKKNAGWIFEGRRCLWQNSKINHWSNSWRNTRWSLDKFL